MKDFIRALALSAVAFASGGVHASPAPIDQETNVALSSVGAIATASSTFASSCLSVGLLHQACSSGFSPMLAINGERAGANWSASGGWADATPDSYFDDWLRVDFFGTRLIDRVAVYTLQDDWQHPVEPTDAMTFTQYGIQDFTVDAWVDSTQSWQTLAAVTGNNLVKRTVTFSPVRTAAIRIRVTRALGAVSRITEVEAWGVPDATWPAFPVNLALDSRGVTATASSTFGAGFEPSNVIRDVASVNLPYNGANGSGFDWTVSGGWADGTPDQYPDWLELHLPVVQSIDRVRIWTLPDAYTSTGGPSFYDRITRYGIVDFSVQAWNGADWLTVASVTGNDRRSRTLSFPAIATDRLRVVVTKAQGSLSRITGFEAYPAGQDVFLRSDVAAESRGALATASTVLNADFPVIAVHDGEATGRNWAAGGGWASALDDSAPYVEIAFHGMQTIDEVDLYTVQDAWQNPAPLTESTTFSLYGITAFRVLAWNGASWVQLASVSGNNLVERKVSFAPYTTDRVRIEPLAWLGGVARIVELAAWGVPGPQPGRANVATAGMGSVASASSTLDATFPASAVINGERAGRMWTAGGGWADGTFATSPDSVTVDFKTTRPIDKIDVYTLQDAWQSPVEPEAGMTFTQYGISDFTVEALASGSWVTVGSAVSNNLVKRTFTFMPMTASAVRVTVTSPSQYLSRITEIEAWEPVAASCGAGAPASVTDFTLAYGAPSTLRLATGAVGAAVLPPLSTGSSLAQLAQSVVSPPNGTVDMAISPCKGLLDQGAGGCYLTLNNPMSATLPWTSSRQAQQPGTCFIDPDQTYYLNVRYTYAPFACGVAECGYAIQANYGP